ncbi:hypothetical protein H9P43_004593 [Blastocladiella emersonii ATCC 22665]|nr:hypothetical protein H9P43_004593 [Blastocladiella emersonii ATCC 22665]
MKPLAVTKLEVPGSDPDGHVSPRTGASATPLPDGRVFVFGGASPEEGLANAVFELRIDGASSTAKWKSLDPLNSAPPPPPRYDHAAVLVHAPEATDTTGALVHQDSAVGDSSEGGLDQGPWYARPTLVVVGGAGPDGKCLNDVWSYDIDRHQWTPRATKGTPPSPRNTRGAAVLHPRDPLTLIMWAGGADGASAVKDAGVYSLNLRTMEWTRRECENGPAPRLGHTMAAVADQEVLVLGGIDGDQLFADAWILDIDAWSWRKVGDGPAFAVTGHCAIALPRAPRSTSIAPASSGDDNHHAATETAVVWNGGLSQSLETSREWWWASAATGWEPAPLGEGVERLDHCTFQVSAGHGEEEGAIKVAVFGGMTHEGIFNDVHLVEL